MVSVKLPHRLRIRHSLTWPIIGFITILMVDKLHVRRSRPYLSNSDDYQTHYRDHFNARGRFSERLSHRCEVSLPHYDELDRYPFSTWSPSRFVAYYNIHNYLRRYINTAPYMPQVLDFGGSVFLKPFNKSINVTKTIHPVVDIHKTHFSSNQFDIVCADQVLEHVLYPPLAMLELKRILKPKGIAILTTVAYNPVHESKQFHDLWRFMVKGLLVLSVPFDGGIKVCGSWGTRNYTATRVLHGMGSETEKRMFQLKQNFVLMNENKNPSLVWIIVEK